MARRKNKEIGLTRPALALVGGGVVLGVGSSVIGGVGGTTAGAAQSGLTTFASFAPVIGATFGAGLVVRQLRSLEEQVQTKRKRR